MQQQHDATAAAAGRHPLVVELDSASETSPPGFLEGECGVTLRPHQLALVRRCAQLEAGQVPLQQSLVALFGGGAAAGSDGPAAAAAAEEEGEDVETLRTRVGIIGDKAGAGKSFVLLALVASGRGTRSAPDAVVRSFAEDRVVITAHRRRPHATAASTSTSTVASGESHDVSLLVVPHNLCAQWEGYVARWNTSNARPLRCASINRTKHLAALREAGALDALDLIVVTSSFYNMVAAAIGRARIRRIMFDEADSLAISRCANLDASFHWFVTASYRNLLHPFGDGVSLTATYTQQQQQQQQHQRTTGIRSTGFVKQLFAELASSTQARIVAHALVAKCSDAFVDSSMLLPAPVATTVRSRAPASVRVLSGVAGIDRAIIACLNAGDVESALSHVDAAHRGSEANIVAALMAKLVREAHNIDVRIGVLDTMSFPTDELRTAEAARLGRRRDDIVRRTATIRERIASTDTCCICYDGIANKTVAPCCSNAFCFTCINRWLIGSDGCGCPLCKAPLAARDLLVVDLVADATDATCIALSPRRINGTSDGNDKLQNLGAILRDRCATPGASKVLIFSSFDNTFVDIVGLLDRAGIRHRFLKGNHPTVACIEREYRTGTLDVLLVNTSNYGSGLNFENTTDVVMLHKFDTDIEHQVIGRAQRCGRTTPLNVWYLLHDNEIVNHPE